MMVSLMCRALGLGGTNGEIPRISRIASSFWICPRRELIPSSYCAGMSRLKAVPAAPKRGFARLLQVPSMVLNWLTVGKKQFGGSRTSTHSDSCHMRASSSEVRRAPGLWKSSSARASACAATLWLFTMVLRLFSYSFFSAALTIFSYLSAAMPCLRASSDGFLKNLANSWLAVYLPSFSSCVWTRFFLASSLVLNSAFTSSMA